MVTDFSVSELSDSGREAWDRFVQRQNGSFYQLSGWKSVLEEAYGLHCHYLLFSEGGSLVAVLPLACGRLHTRHKAWSLPFCNYSGLLGMGGVDRDRVLDAATSYLATRGVRQFQLRELDAATSDGLSDEVTMILALAESEEKLWDAVGPKTRNLVRKSEKSGLLSTWGMQQLDEFYAIYARNMGRLGTPVHARRFFQVLAETFTDRVDIQIVRKDSKPIAGMLITRFGDTWGDPWASSLQEFNHLSPNMHMYWETLRRATIAGVSRFDFGRSERNSGTYRFKRQWGAQSFDLTYRSYSPEYPRGVIHASVYRSGSARLIASAWSRLPFPVQKALGPRLRIFLP